MPHFGSTWNSDLQPIVDLTAAVRRKLKVGDIWLAELSDGRQPVRIRDKVVPKTQLYIYCFHDQTHRYINVHQLIRKLSPLEVLAMQASDG